MFVAMCNSYYEHARIPIVQILEKRKVKERQLYMIKQ